jgi:molybdate-binding protein/DNA-binding XRE family transcriptional regulator
MSLIKKLRKQRGWTQADLASRANVSRSAIACIENGTMIPTVTNAISIAKVLEVSVEKLFAHEEKKISWAWEPPLLPYGYWEIGFDSKNLLIPCEATCLGTIPFDGWFDGNSLQTTIPHEPEKTLLIACCDPAIKVLADMLYKQHGVRVIALYRSSGKSLSLLEKGLVHVAGLHFAGVTDKVDNGSFVRDKLGAGYQLIRGGIWTEGVALRSKSDFGNTKELFTPEVFWVGREEGTGARICQDLFFEGKEAPQKTAKDHNMVAALIQQGWADAGICQQFCATQNGLDFIPVRKEIFDFCYSKKLENDIRIQALNKTICSKKFREVLQKQTGYDTSTTGEISFS